MSDALAPRTLNDGHSIPAIGFGSYPHHGEDSDEMVTNALDLGYRLIDTALRYENEVEVGAAIRRSSVPRDEIVVTSKLAGRHHGAAEARDGVAQSLKNLGLETIDLFLIHWPLPKQGKFVDTWKTLVELRDEGKLRSIGVSNFTPQHLEQIIDATGVVPAVNQVELHPAFTQVELRKVHDELGIVTEAWSPLGRGTGLLDEPVIRDAAEKYGVTTGQIALRWHVQQGIVPIPMSSNPVRRAANLELAGFELTDDEVAAISALDRGRIWGQDPDEHEEF
ncbi:aldo/keto reductase [Schumannella luteola]|uniref:Diketogulonate reductase-like aldo/keto reductase n=1 Tax=Schumannella luteola TaxID=472059 RepID=A0A852YIV9_9MICO|nr:aldo/keto reductase [Schumannella luteola]NYG97719.1 diketogulonate reductase-like aldo/keto reductase [Schumannella luteola]TPX01414.1 aldo/keto reductase [Schumannella luteola]